MAKALVISFPFPVTPNPANPCEVHVALDDLRGDGGLALPYIEDFEVRGLEELDPDVASRVTEEARRAAEAVLLPAWVGSLVKAKIGDDGQVDGTYGILDEFPAS